MNQSDERRRSPRVDTAIPVRLQVRGRSLEGDVCDLSRIGARVRVRLSEFGLKPDCDLDEVSRIVCSMLGENVQVDLNHHRLGTLVQRTLRVVRVSRPSSPEGVVDIGCMLRVPLSEDEVGALGLSIPDCHLPEGVYTSHEAFAKLATRRRDYAGADIEAEPMNAVAFLSPQPGFPGTPVRANDVTLEKDTVTLRFGTRRGAPLGVAQRDASAVFERFVNDYGPQACLLVIANRRPRWSGTVRLRAVEVDPLRDELFMEFACEATQADPRTTVAPTIGTRRL